MSSSREDSPDWLRSFQAPTCSTLTLSSDSNSNSDSSPTESPSRDEITPNQCKETAKNGDLPQDQKEDRVYSGKNKKKKEDTGRGGKKKVDKQEVTFQDPQAINHSVWTLSSDSESDKTTIATAMKKDPVKVDTKDGDAVLVGSSELPPSKEALKEKSPKKRTKAETQTPSKEKSLDNNVQREEVTEEDTSEKHNVSHVSTSRLPLVLPEKVHRSKALVECEGDSIDLSGDMGAVGRIMIPNTQCGDTEMYLDLKGTIYKTTILPSRTFCVVSFGQSEAKIEAIMNDFIQLKPQSNVYEAETMVEGTLEGFSFDSEDEADKIPKAISRQSDQNENIDEQNNGKKKRKAEKSSGMPRKKGKAAGGKAQPANKSRKKTQISKKAKNKK